MMKTQNAPILMAHITVPVIQAILAMEENAVSEFAAQIHKGTFSCVFNNVADLYNFLQLALMVKYCSTMKECSLPH